MAEVNIESTRLAVVWQAFKREFRHMNSCINYMKICFELINLFFFFGSRAPTQTYISVQNMDRSGKQMNQVYFQKTMVNAKAGE